jgi:hypothetical protein
VLLAAIDAPRRTLPCGRSPSTRTPAPRPPAGTRPHDPPLADRGILMTAIALPNHVDTVPRIRADAGTRVGQRLALRATRKPRSSRRKVGKLRRRTDARQLQRSSNHPPPRKTR